MGKLLKFELKKLLRAKSFYICLGISFAFILINVLFNKFELDSYNAYYETNLDIDPRVIIVSYANTGYLVILTSVFTSIFICDDYSQGTIKNIFARGYSRMQVFFAKYITILISTVAFLLVDILIDSGLNCILFHGLYYNDPSFAWILILQALLIIAYNSLYFFVAISLPKLGFAIVISILGPTLIGLILSLMTVLLKNINIDLTTYWLTGCESLLDAGNLTSASILKIVVVCTAVIGASIGFGWLIHNKRQA